MPDNRQNNWQEYLDNCQNIIAKYGWAIQGISSNPFWTYTVGLNRLYLPELVAVGLPFDMAKDILNTAARQHVTNQLRPGVLDIGWSVRFLVLQIDSEPLTIARLMNGDQFQSKALQLVWPKENGIYDSGSQVVPV